MLINNTREGGGGRSSNIECLRCIAMLFIVMNHCILNIAAKRLTLNEEPINFLLTDYTYQVVYNGVNIFVLISGYFLIQSTRSTTNWKKVFKLWLSVFFYSLTIYLFSLGLHIQQFDLPELIHALMPVRYDSYWFITQYIGLYILSPFLTKWGRSLSKQEYNLMLFSFFIIVSIMQLSGLKGGFSLIWFVFLFMFAGYLRLFKDDSNITKLIKYSGRFFILTSFLLFALSLVFNRNVMNIVSYWGFYNGPLLFISSVSLFLFFNKLKENKIITIVSKLAPYMFGVYLLHENPIVKSMLWEYLNTALATVSLPILCGISMIIMLIGIIIEYTRLKLFKVLNIDNLFYECIEWCYVIVISMFKNIYVRYIKG